MDTPEPRTTPVLYPPPRRRRPRRYLSHLLLPSDLPPDPVAPAAPLPLLHRVLSGLRALPATAPASPAPPAAPTSPWAGWKCTVPGCLWESINPMSHPCPFPPAASAGAARPGTRSGAAAPAPDPGTATLADLTRRLLARNPALGAPSEEREPSPDVVRTRELPVVTAQGGAR